MNPNLILWKNLKLIKCLVDFKIHKNGKDNCNEFKEAESKKQFELNSGDNNCRINLLVPPFA